MEKNFYEELGLKKNATRSEIKSSYRSLVKQHHPDAGGKKERFLAIQNAWETLNDPIKKEQYDSNIPLPVHHLIHYMKIGKRNLIQKNIILQLRTKKLKHGLKKFTVL